MSEGLRKGSTTPDMLFSFTLYDFSDLPFLSPFRPSLHPGVYVLCNTFDFLFTTVSSLSDVYSYLFYGTYDMLRKIDRSPKISVLIFVDLVFLICKEER